MQFFTICLPTKAYLKKYIHTLYGDPVVIKASNVFADVFLAMLQVPVPVKHSRPLLDQQLNRYSSIVEVKVPVSMFYRLPKEPGEHSVIRINRFFENRFEEDLAKTVGHMQAILQIERQQAIEKFAEDHRIDIDVDITMDALKKKDYRFRKEKEEISKLSLPNLSSAKNLFN
jgi:hypothetical protein